MPEKTQWVEQSQKDIFVSSVSGDAKGVWLLAYQGRSMTEEYMQNTSAAFTVPLLTWWLKGDWREVILVLIF